MYFKIIPDLNYLKYTNNPYQGELFRVKNLFTRSVFSRFAARFATIFDTYEVKDSDRPDTIAYDLYGDSYYDWVVIVCNERLINFYDQWPKQAAALEQYAVKKYGTKLYDIHHYETLEIRDSNDNIILESGLKVDSTFSFTYTDGGTIFTKSGSLVKIPITNFDYEHSENNKKRIIQLLQPQFLTLFENEYKNNVLYNPNSPNSLSTYLKTTENNVFPTI